MTSVLTANGEAQHYGEAQRRCGLLAITIVPPCTAFTTNETLFESVLERDSNPLQIDYESIALPE
jgi:hypothetical protein